EALGELKGLLRSKGFCWIASRPELVAIWSQAGPNLTFEPAAQWGSIDEEPGQEIVFIGVKLHRDRIRAAFDAALLTDAELAAGPVGWRAYPDPFPAWSHHEHA
ncbi:MAG: cobalamin biosynthesis protein CobW, partial [Mycobacteriaceae bacterium]|nr:cobalamin biosynthesis protein CobW [Mycobacteriaceae bacterium]